VEKKVPVRPKPKRRLTMQMDELSSSVNHYRQQAVGVASRCPNPLSQSAQITSSFTLINNSDG